MNTPDSFVDGNYVVIPSKLAFPMRCVKTNTEVTEKEYEVFALPYLPTWLVIWMLIAPVILLAAPLIVRRRCRFKAGLSSRVRRHYQFRKLATLIIMVGSIIALPVAIFYGTEFFVFISCLLLVPILWVGFVVLTLYSSPLKIAKYKGGMFWVSGCSLKFLEDLNLPSA